MRYIYVFLMIIGALASLLGLSFLGVALFSSQSSNALSSGFSALIGGVVLIALGDMGSKLSNLRQDFDFFMAQQRRPPTRFLKPTSDDESE